MLKVSSERLAAGMLGIAAAVLACLAPAQSDTWWLLRAGRDIVATHSIPLVDTYSYTAAGLFWPNHEWMTEVVFYLVHAAAGMPGLALLSAGMIMTGLVLAWRLAEGSFEVKFILFGIALVSSAAAFAIRPQVFTIAAFSLTCWLLRHDRLWLVPVLIVVWVNFHGAAVLGLIAVVAAFVSDVVSVSSFRRERSDLGRGVLVVVASAAATLVSPLGTRLWTFIPESTERSKINQLIEWTAPDFSAGHLPFWAAAAALIVLTLLRWRRLDRNRRRVLMVALAVLPLAVQSMRNVHVFLLAALPAMTMLVQAEAAPRAARKPVKENERVNAAILMTLGAGAAIAVALVWLRPPAMLKWRPVSPAAAQTIARCGSPLYNTYGQGGELIWFVPEQRVFIDNRQDPFPMDVLRLNRKLEWEGDVREVFNRFGIQCAAVPPSSLVAATLSKEAGWAERFRDRQWAVFTRN